MGITVLRSGVCVGRRASVVPTSPPIVYLLPTASPEVNINDKPQRPPSGHGLRCLGDFWWQFVQFKGRSQGWNRQLFVHVSVTGFRACDFMLHLPHKMAFSGVIVSRPMHLPPHSFAIRSILDKDLYCASYYDW